jgi:hypothetical protein
LENNFTANSSNVFPNGSSTSDIIQKAVRSMENNKLSCDDRIVNEYICFSVEYMINVYLNLIFTQIY